MVQPSASELRRREEEKDELSENPPDTNRDLQDCSEEDWRKFREEQTAKLMAAPAKARAISEVEEAPTIQGVDTVTSATASTANTASTLKSGTLRSTAVPYERDQQNLQEIYDFSNQELSWKIPIIEYKERILDIVGGEIYSLSASQ